MESTEAMWKIWLGAGVLAAGICSFVATGQDARLVAFIVMGLASATAVVVGLLRNRPAAPMPFVLATAGCLSFVLGEVLYRWLESTSEFVPYPSIADVFYLAAYPLIGFAVGTAASRTGNPRHTAAVWGAVIVGAAATVAIWRLYGSQIVTDESAGTALLVSLAYPVFAVAVLAASSYALFATNQAHAQPLLLAAAGLSWFTADALYNNALYNARFTPGGAEDFFWLQTFVLVAAAACVPTSTSISDDEAQLGVEPAMA